MIADILYFLHLGVLPQFLPRFVYANSKSLVIVHLETIFQNFVVTRGLELILCVFVLEAEIGSDDVLADIYDRQQRKQVVRL